MHAYEYQPELELLVLLQNSLHAESMKPVSFSRYHSWV